MSDNKQTSEKSELLLKLDELLENVGDKYGPFMLQELYSRMEKTINEFNQELDAMFESSFEQTRNINKAVTDAIVSGSTPNVSNLNISNKEVPSFIIKKETKNSKQNSKNKQAKKKTSFFSRKNKK